MNKIIKEVLNDLKSYTKLFGIDISDESKDFITDVESFAEKCDNPVMPDIYLSFLINNMEIIKNLFVKNNLNSELAIHTLKKKYVDSLDKLDHYDLEYRFYSHNERREFLVNTRILDIAMEICIRNKRKQIYNIDFLEALLQYHEEENELWNNGGWNDVKLHVPYNTLSHILGEYYLDLWIKFDDIREEIKLVNKELAKLGNLKIA
ncbi:MAG: hypothetical protein E7211_17090 [Clostridium lundense]|nr:hypothetical protein [Clostridium lundense]